MSKKQSAEEKWEALKERYGTKAEDSSSLTDKIMKLVHGKNFLVALTGVAGALANLFVASDLTPEQIDGTLNNIKELVKDLERNEK